MAKETALLSAARPEGGYAQLQDMGGWSSDDSLRMRILRGDEMLVDEVEDEFSSFTVPRHEGSPLTDSASRNEGAFWSPRVAAPLDLQDTILRRSLESDRISDWYRLYLLSWLCAPLPSDKQQAGSIWDEAVEGTDEDQDKRLLVVDLLLRWGDVDRLVNLSASCPPGPVRTEIIWGLAQARHPQVATYLESEIRDVWAPAFSKGDIYWAGYYWACRKSALRLEGSFDLGPIEEYLERPPEEVREAVEEIRRRVCMDEQLDVNLRLCLLSGAAGETDWGRPLLQSLGRELLAQDPSDEAFEKVVWAYRLAGQTTAMAELWREDMPLERQDTLFDWWRIGDERDALTLVFEKALSQVWKDRYIQTNGEDPVFQRSPEFLADHMFPFRGIDRRTEFVLKLIEDSTVPAGYRAFLACALRPEALEGMLPVIEALARAELPDAVSERLRKLEQEIASQRDEEEQG